MTRKIAKPRIYPATVDGTDDFSEGNCVLMSSETLAQKRLTQGVRFQRAVVVETPGGQPRAQRKSGCMR